MTVWFFAIWMMGNMAGAGPFQSESECLRERTSAIEQLTGRPFLLSSCIEAKLSQAGV